MQLQLYVRRLKGFNMRLPQKACIHSSKGTLYRVPWLPSDEKHVPHTANYLARFNAEI